MAIHRSVFLLAGAVAIVVAPLVIPGLGGEFKGRRPWNKAIEEAAPATSLFQPLWKPPSDEVENMLFSLQAALGAGFLGYVIGRRQSSRANVAGR